MANDKLLYDGFGELTGGADSERQPDLLPMNRASRLINVTTRNGYAKSRPGFTQLKLVFANQDQRVYFETHKMQGVAYYDVDQTIIASIGGRLYRINPVTGAVSDLFGSTTANSSLLNQAYLCQADKYMVIQDGISSAVVIDGGTTRRADHSINEVPTGTIMTYGQGRLWIASTDFRDFIAGDIYGGPTDILRFTENQYLSGGGSFKLPMAMGRITAMIFIAQQDTATGQGDLFVFGEYGIVSINASIPRDNVNTAVATWQTNDISKNVLHDIGCSGPYNLTRINGDIFFRSYDGLRSYRMARGVINEWANVPQSREISPYLDADAQFWLYKGSMIDFDNRLLMTVRPTISGDYIYNNGLMALDFDLLANLQGKQPPSYDELWTGIRPTALVEGLFNNVKRCFAFSYDEDQVNRIYEITTRETFDIQTQRIPSVIETRSFGFGANTEVGGFYTYKELYELELWLSEIIGSVDFTVYYRPDFYPGWILWESFTICSNQGDCTTCLPTFNQSGYSARKHLGKPVSSECHQERKLNYGYQFQLRIEFTGHAKINRCRIAAAVQTDNTRVVSCDDAECDDITLCLPDDFSYKIITSTS